MAIDERIRNLLINGTTGQRLELCRREPMYFAIWYFPEYFTHKIPPFHYDFYSDCKALTDGTYDEVAWIAAREFGKTALAKIALIIWCIAYKKKNYINVDSYDKSNAESILFDVTVALQSNKKLISDFGHIYHPKPQKDAMSEAKMKRIANFITETGIKVEAFSTQESTRGRLYKNMRPDLIVFDDIENNKTKDSYPVIHKIKEHIDEWRAGRTAGASGLYLGNYITEGGVVEYVMDLMKRNERSCLRLVNIVNKSGEPNWPDKHVLTKTEAAVINTGIADPRSRKRSIEEIKESLGNSVFEAEMMNNPAHGGDKLFDREAIDALLKLARPPIRTVAGLKIWYEYNPSHRYAIAADTAKGVGKDSNASCIIDFSTTPNRVVATYKNNLMSPDIFGYELKRQGELYGIPLIAPENNNTGYATLMVLKKIYPTSKIFIPLQQEKVKEKLDEEYGWNTNSATKPEMTYQFKSAVEDGKLVIYDEDMLNECKYYSQKDLVTMKLVEGMTRHFDLMTSGMICWMMRTHAKISVIGGARKVVQAQHVPIAGEYGG